MSAPQPMTASDEPTSTPAPEDCRTMTDVRAGVDALDALLVPLLAKRLRYMAAAAHIKPFRSDVRDETRKQAVIARARNLADACGAPEAVVARIYDALVEASIAYEFDIFDDRDNGT